MISLSLYRLSFASSPLPGTHFVDAPGWALKSIRSDRSNRFAFKFRERGERTWKRERGSLIIPLKHWRNSPGESSLRINRPSNQPAYESISLRINRRLLIATVCLVTLLLKCIVWVACSRGARSCTALISSRLLVCSLWSIFGLMATGGQLYRPPIVQIGFFCNRSNHLKWLQWRSSSGDLAMKNLLRSQGGQVSRIESLSCISINSLLFAKVIFVNSF